MPARLSIPRALQVVDRPVFTTREIAALRGGSVPATSQALRRMESAGVLTRAMRGVWCVFSDRRFTPYSLVPFLAGAHRAYVSFLSALHLHGLIDQIPQVIHAATTAHTRTCRTAVGTYALHQVSPRLFGGFDWHRERETFLVASPEKALVDCLYLSSRKGRRFGRLPEIELPRRFSMRRVREWVRRIDDPRIRKHVLERLESLGVGSRWARA